MSLSRQRTQPSLSCLVIRTLCLALLVVSLAAAPAGAQHPILPGSDHSFENHSNHDHSNEDLSGVNFTSANLNSSSLVNSNLSGANFTAANLGLADLRNNDVMTAITAAQLHSAASVTGVNLSGNDLSIQPLNSLNFASANFSGTNLSSSDLNSTNFASGTLVGANLSSALAPSVNFSLADLTSADLSNAHLLNVIFSLADLTGADLSNASVNDAQRLHTAADFSNSNLTNADLRNGNVLLAITAAQLRSTASVTGINLSGNYMLSYDLTGMDFTSADFRNTNLTAAGFFTAKLNSANLSGANFSGADLRNADLRNSNVAGAISSVQLHSAASVTGANLSGNNFSGFDFSGLNLSGVNLRNSNVAGAVSAAQLQSSASVTGVNLSGNDLSGFDLSGLNLSGANLKDAWLTSVNFAGANLSSADLTNHFFSLQITAAQLRSAASVTGVNLSGNILNGFDLSGLNLSGANLHFSSLTGANFTATDLNGADLRTGIAGLQISVPQLRSAASVSGVNLSGNTNLSGSNLSGLGFDSANLSNTDLRAANFTDANLTDANLTSADLSGSNLTGANFTDSSLTGVNLHQAQLPSTMPVLPVIATAEVTVNKILDVAGAVTVQAGGTLAVKSLLTAASMDMQGRLEVVNSIAPAITTPGIATDSHLSLIEVGGTFDADNLAAGETPLALDELGAGIHFTSHLNDLTYGNSNSWIGNGATGASGPFAGIGLATSETISSIAWGRDNNGTFGDRSLGTYEVQYRNDGSTADDAGWITLGEVTYSEGDAHLRHRFSFDAIDATAVRLIVPDTMTAIDEIELYSVPVGELDVAGLLNVGAGSTLELSGGTVESGSLNVAGVVEFRQADYGFGSGPALMTSGDLTFTDTAQLQIELSSESVANLTANVLTAAGTAILDGVLDISLMDGYMPGLGDMFEILSAGSLSGVFAAENLPTLTEQLAWEVTYGTAVTLSVVEVTPDVLPGDFNDDGIVNAADYTVWRDNLGAPAGTLLNDPSGVVIGSTQYDNWAANYGATAPSSTSSSSVPEPSTLLLSALVGITGTTFRRR